MRFSHLTINHLLPIVLAAFVAIIVFWPKLGHIEGEFLPVVTDIKIIEERAYVDGVSVSVYLDKKRYCEFIGINWYKDDVRLLIDFEPTSANLPVTRSTGPQFVGPWFLHEIQSVKGTHAEVIHQCHPLWKTVTQFYP